MASEVHLGAPTATVVIVDWNEPGVTLEAVHSVLDDPLPDVEIVVVDNGSERTTAGHPAAALPGVRVIRLPENVGFAAGANAGMAAARGEFVVLLNNDARIVPGALGALLAPLADPAIAAVTALILLDGTEPELVNSSGGEVTRSGNGRDRDWRVPLAQLARRSGPVPAFSGGAVALRPSAVVDAGGPFDERLFMYYEDTELSWRVRRRGWEIRFQAEARVRHRHAHSSGAGSEFFLRYNERNRLRFVLVHGTGWVIARAFARTLGSAAARLLHGDARSARRKAAAAAHAIGRLPELMRSRRAARRTARVPLRALWYGAPHD